MKRFWLGVLPELVVAARVYDAIIFDVRAHAYACKNGFGERDRLRLRISFVGQA